MYTHHAKFQFETPGRGFALPWLDHDQFLELYDQHAVEINQRRRHYEKYIDFEESIKNNRELWESLADDDGIENLIPTRNFNMHSEDV